MISIQLISFNTVLSGGYIYFSVDMIFLIPVMTAQKWEISFFVFYIIMWSLVFCFLSGFFLMSVFWIHLKLAIEDKKIFLKLYWFSNFSLKLCLTLQPYHWYTNISLINFISEWAELRSFSLHDTEQNILWRIWLHHTVWSTNHFIYSCITLILHYIFLLFCRLPLGAVTGWHCGERLFSISPLDHYEEVAETLWVIL